MQTPPRIRVCQSVSGTQLQRGMGRISPLLCTHTPHPTRPSPPTNLPALHHSAPNGGGFSSFRCNHAFLQITWFISVAGSPSRQGAQSAVLILTVRGMMGKYTSLMELPLRCSWSVVWLHVWIPDQSCSTEPTHFWFSQQWGNEWPSLCSRDYVSQLLCVEGFRGSQQIRDWGIKLGDFKKIPQTVFCLSPYHQFKLATNTGVCISGQRTLSTYVLIITTKGVLVKMTLQKKKTP